MSTFENINDHIVYVKAKSKTEALSLRNEAQETVQKGKNVAVLFGKRYHLYLAPGHDPYQVRKDIDAFLNPPPDEPKSKSKSDKPKVEDKTTPVRDASGKFVSTKHSVLEPDSPVKEPPKKKSIWDALK